MDSDTQELSALLRYVPQVVVASLMRKPRQVLIPDPSCFTAAVALFDISGVSVLGSNLSDLEKNQIKTLSLTTLEIGQDYRQSAEQIRSIDATKSKIRGHNKVGNEQSTPNSHRASSPGSSSTGRRNTSATYSSVSMSNSIAADTLTTTLNKAFQPILNVIARHSGDIIKFTGDTMIVLWETEISLQSKTPAGILAYRAARCAIEALRALRSATSSGNNNRLSMKIGIGTSEVTPHYVGGVRDRWEFYISGSANRQMSLALQHAPRGNVALSLEAYGALAYSMAMKELRHVEMNANTVENGVHVITRLSHSPLAQASRSSIQPNLEVIPALRGYVPGPILSCLGNGLVMTSSAREVTVISIKLLGIVEMSDYAQQSREIRRVVCIIQTAAHKFQGTLNHFIVDGKNTIAEVIMGLPPFYHEDNAARGARLAYSLANQGVQASIGVTTGTVFYGPVGGRVRSLCTVAGTVLDLAKCLMHGAKTGEILCDASTYEEAKASITFSAADRITVRNRSEPLTIYCVLSEKGIADSDTRNRSAPPPYGCQHVLDMVPQPGEVDARDLSYSSPEPKRLLVVSGDAGTGKTMLVQYLRDKHSQCYIDHGNPVNPDLRLRAWGGIVRELIRQTVMARPPSAPEKLQLSPIASREGSFLAIEEESCPSRVDSQSFSDRVMAEIEQDSLTRSRHSLVAEERIPLLDALESEGYAFSAILPILNDLLPRDQLLETDIIPFQQGEERAKALEEIILSMLTVLSRHSRILLLFDNAQLMDEDSWLLLRRALDEAPNVCALMTIRSKRRLECPVMLEHARIMENASQVHLRPFSYDVTSQFLGKVYQISPMNSKLLDFVYSRADGNPSETVKLVDFMIEETFISIDRKRGTVKILSELEDLDMGVPQYTRAHVMACVDNLEGLAQIAIKVISVNPGPVQERLLISILQVFLNSQQDGSTNDLADIVIKLDSSLAEQLRAGMSVCSREGVLSVDNLEKIYAFHSEEMRLVVYDLMVPSQRQLIHMLYCQWFTELCASNSGMSTPDAKLKLDAEGSYQAEITGHRYLSRVGYHLLGARSVRLSLDTYQKAAEQAIEAEELYFASEYLTSSLRILDEQALHSKAFTELDLIAMRSRIEFVHGTIAVRTKDWDKAIKHMTLVVTMCDSKATTLRRYSSEVYADSMINEMVNIRQPHARAIPADTKKQETASANDGLLQRCTPRFFSFGWSKPQRSLSSSMRVAPAVDARVFDSLKQVNYYRTKAGLLIKTIKESKLKQAAMAQEIQRLMNQPLRSQQI